MLKKGCSELRVAHECFGVGLRGDGVANWSLLLVSFINIIGLLWICVRMIRSVSVLGQEATVCLNDITGAGWYVKNFEINA